ncbi:hypothetical protein DIPPA_34745 [Diplonema papillatum]|nr:hypothetical protein DIPPA_14044 [Diplonema papillatum]KAJ9442380.1 hypothetical protein DIPPA_34745 [Diplonema papillatum]
MCDACKQYVENFTLLRAEFEKQKGELATAKRKHDQDRLVIKQLEAKLQERTDDVIQLSQERDMEKARFRNMEDNWHKLKDLHDSKSGVRTTDMASLRLDSEKFVQTLQVELQSQSMTLQNIREQLRNTQSRLSIEQEKSMELTSEILALQEREKGAAQDQQVLEHDVKDLHAKLIKKESELHKLEIELAELRTDNEYQKSELRTTLEKDEKKFHKEVADLKRHVSALQQSRDDAAQAAESVEAKWKLLLQREREEFHARQAEAIRRTRDAEGQLVESAKQAERRLDALREEMAVLARDSDISRKQRSDLESSRAELTARVNRLAKSEAACRAEVLQLQEDKTKVHRELDKFTRRLSDAQTVESKLSLVDMQLRYKEQELQEARQEVALVTAERVKILAVMQKLVDKEKRAHSRSRKGQQKLVHILNDFALQNHQLEDQVGKLTSEYDSFKRNINLRQEAAAVLSRDTRDPTLNKPAFVPDPNIFESLTENFKRLSMLEQSQEHV